MQSGGALVLPHISDILEQVDRQMLLILKTNDLIRGIETTLGTQNRMTAFWVMSKCCIRSIQNESYANSQSFWRTFATSIAANWSVLKLNLFYLYRGLCTFHFYSSMKMLFV